MANDRLDSRALCSRWPLGASRHRDLLRRWSWKSTTLQGPKSTSSRSSDSLQYLATRSIAPRIEECYAKFECRLADGRLISKYGFFIWEVVKAHVAVFPKYPKTLHYRGDGVFMVSGGSLNRRRKFKPQNL